MKPSILTNLAAVLLLSPVAALAMPQEAPAPPNQRRQGEPQMRRNSEGRGLMQRRAAARAELGLTDVQKSDMRKAVESARRDRLRKSTDLRIAKMDLQSLLRADQVDEKAVAAKLAEAQAAQGALMKLKVDTALAMKRILTPEQQKKMSEMRASRGSRLQKMKMRGMKGRGQGRMGRPTGPGAPRGPQGPDSDLDLDLDMDLDPPADPLVSR